jgi:hypothetical protein
MPACPECHRDQARREVIRQRDGIAMGISGIARPAQSIHHHQPKPNTSFGRATWSCAT